MKHSIALTTKDTKQSSHHLFFVPFVSFVVKKTQFPS